jgi:hypothetical protein
MKRGRRKPIRAKKARDKEASNAVDILREGIHRRL